VGAASPLVSPRMPFVGMGRAIASACDTDPSGFASK
jgi:hypothetical protein